MLAERELTVEFCALSESALERNVVCAGDSGGMAESADPENAAQKWNDQRSVSGDRRLRKKRFPDGRRPRYWPR